MPKATFKIKDGSACTLEVSLGKSLMLAAVGAGVQDIVAECGGVMSCASCHVIVEETYREACPPIADTEDQMLEFTAAPRDAGSRLSCQLTMSDAMDGIVVRVADPQI